MEIVIRIPEIIVEHIKDGSFGARKDDRATLIDAVMNGTPLPKHHGRLIDADKLEENMYHEAFETDTNLQKWESGCWIRYKMFENKMNDAPAIIEADK